MPGATTGVGGALGGVAGAAGGVAGSIASAGVGAAFEAAGTWVAEGARWLLDQVGALLSTSTSAGLGTRWFGAHESVMVVLAAAVVLPLAFAGAIQAIYRQSAAVLLRSFLVHLPLALLLTGVAVELVRLALGITDTLSQRVLSAGGVDARHVLAPVSNFLGASGVVVPQAPLFVVFVAGVIVAVLAFALWVELAVRAAAVSAAALFLPLALATLVWPAISHWCRRLAETLTALVLSKFVVAAVLSLAAGAIAGGLGTEGPNGGGFPAVITGIALLLIATLSPFTLLRMVPAVEAGAVAHLESVRHRVGGAARSAGRARSFAVELAEDAGVTKGAGAAGGAAAAAGVVAGDVSGAGAAAGVIGGGDDTASGASAGEGVATEGAGPARAEGAGDLTPAQRWYFDNSPEPGGPPGDGGDAGGREGRSAREDEAAPPRDSTRLGQERAR